MIKNCYTCRFHDNGNGMIDQKCITCVSNAFGFSSPSNWLPMTDEKLKALVLTSKCLTADEKNYLENDIKALGRAYNEMYKQKALNRIEKVIFNDPATIVFWNDGTKTVVKCGNDDTFDPEKGLAMAISKYFFDNAGYFNDVFKQWIPKK